MLAENGAQFSNELHVVEYSGAVDTQKAVTSMLSELLHIEPEDARIVYTLGGTHSIFQAISAYVVKARQVTSNPILLVGESSHFAFDKAAELTGARYI